ncbi:hypothetical protein ASZ90_003216 [hydrocarbon metagenome]|uniref:DUF1684 domain-containing protein n=1 Tax=hydrocarbon metagenome TaxID=938273 RepID=A0A0W8G1A8_9ZZZZ
MYRFIIIAFTSFILLCSCGEENYPEKGTPGYIQEINQWHVHRVERLKQPSGWLNLAGLFWLKEGENTFGSDESNDLIFPKDTTNKIGSFVLNDSVVALKVYENVDVLVDSQLVKEFVLIPDTKPNTTKINLGSYEWNLIIRSDDMYGIRLRDLDTEILKTFKGVERFPVNEDWRISAEFQPFDPPIEIDIPTIIGTIEKDYSPGKLVFNINDKEYELFPTKSGNGLFIVFADLTSGEETYGAGRFLYTDMPDSNNIVILDFNKAYNPPCAFSKYATCPLPPKENYLKIRITAGEKNYDYGH